MEFNSEITVTDPAIISIAKRHAVSCRKGVPLTIKRIRQYTNKIKTMVVYDLCGIPQSIYLVKHWDIHNKQPRYSLLWDSEIGLGPTETMDQYISMTQHTISTQNGKYKFNKSTQYKLDEHGFDGHLTARISEWENVQDHTHIFTAIESNGFVTTHEGIRTSKQYIALTS